MTDLNTIKEKMIGPEEQKTTNEPPPNPLNNEKIPFRNREQSIEEFERILQEKNAHIVKLEEREKNLDTALQKRNAEFLVLEANLFQYEDKTRMFEQLHQLQVQTFGKTIRDCQIENERLCEQINDLTRELSGKTSLDEITQEKILAFDRIVSDVQLWRQKLDSYKETIEEREETIVNLKKEINELHKLKQTNVHCEEHSLRLQILNLENTLEDRDKEIEHLKSTLCRVRNTLQCSNLSCENRWNSCSDNIGRNVSVRKSLQRQRSISPAARKSLLPTNQDVLNTKFHVLTDRLVSAQQLLLDRDNQIATLRKVHDKRWLRLKHLQKQYRLLKNELQSYTDDETTQFSRRNDFYYRKAVRKTKNGCSVCNDHRWKKQKGNNRLFLRQEDDDQVWNEITKLKRENSRLVNENFSLQEKIDLQEVEINEQINLIDELRQEIRRPKFADEPIPLTKHHVKINDEQQTLVKELDKRLYELETERTSLIFENERLKTNLNLCLDEKQHLIEQKLEINNELKNKKLRILALQDQIYKLKRNNPTNSKANVVVAPKLKATSITINRRTIQKKPKKPVIKSCLELLLDQNSSVMEDIHNESIVSIRQRQHSCSLCDYQNECSIIPRKRRPSATSVLSKPRYGTLKRVSKTKNRSNRPVTFPSTRQKSTIPVTTSKTFPTQTSTLRKQIERLENNLSQSQRENEHLNQRLTATLSRIDILKTTNQKLTLECERLKKSQLNQSSIIGHDSPSCDNSFNADNLYERLKNTSFDAAQQRKLNKTLQADNDALNKNLHSLTDKLMHTERDIASKRSLIENYKARISELELNLSRSNDKHVFEVDEDRVKSLNETIEKLRVSNDSYKNRLQAITREKHDVESRYSQLIDEHQKLKIRFEDLQAKARLNEQQLRQARLNNEQLTQELSTCRHSFDQQLVGLNTKNQDSLKKITIELERTLRRSKDFEKFINGIFQEIVQRSLQLNDKLKRSREYQKQRESLSISIPGFDTAMNTASKILNLTQDDLDEIMSLADDSFQVNTKDDTIDKNDKFRHKVSKLLATQEECASKLLKAFNKKLDDLLAADRELSTTRNL